MLENFFDSTPIYRIIAREKKYFNDLDLFGEELYKCVVLKKIKLWYGTPPSGNENIKEKCILGIQCIYQDLVSGIKKTTEQHCGDLNGKDIETKELELKNNNDFFTKFNIDFTYSITHLKFTTKTGGILEFGFENEETKRTCEINMIKEDVMIHSFVGYYNKYGLVGLGCRYILRKKFIFLYFLDIMSLKNYFKINKKERQKWEKPKNINQLSYEMKTIAKLCLLPDKVYGSVMKNISLYSYKNMIIIINFKLLLFIVIFIIIAFISLFFYYYSK